MVKAIVIPTHLLEPIRLQELDPHDLNAYRQIVGGNLAAVNFIEPAAAVYFHDEGKLLKLPLNLRLTTLLWIHNSLFLNEDAIMRPGFIVGENRQSPTCLTLVSQQSVKHVVVAKPN
ncbi:DUF3846 domain-containing protein [Lentzea tibetensis]|nr:DUF3846 domain-containing protein [Lentzea tibetensis]